MTTKQKIQSTKKQIRAMMKDFTELLEKNTETAIKSGLIPDEILQSNNYLLAKMIIDETMKRRPYNAPSFASVTRRQQKQIGQSF